MGRFALSRWPMWRKWFGTRSERAAERFLKRQGFRILGRNVRLPAGELDLIARDGPTIVFVEVRSTAAESTEMPALSVDRKKQQRLTAAAHAFRATHGLLALPARFDVLAVSWPDHARSPRIDHFPDAFPAVGRLQMDY